MNVGPLPHVPHDVACPIISDEGGLTREPYVVAGEVSRRYFDAKPLGEDELPRHLLVLELPAGSYLHLDPRDVHHRLRSLVARGAVPMRDAKVWIFTSTVVGDYGPKDAFWTLFPNTPDRFYFSSLEQRVRAKQAQIADPAFDAAEWYCPEELSVVRRFVRDEEVKAGMDVSAAMNRRERR